MIMYLVYIQYIRICVCWEYLGFHEQNPQNTLTEICIEMSGDALGGLEKCRKKHDMGVS